MSFTLLCLYTLTTTVLAQTPSEDWADFIPLARGKEWAYVDENGERLTIRVEEHKETPDGSCWRMTWSDDFLGPCYEGETWCPREDGLALFSEEVRGRGAALEDGAWVLKSPVRKGTAWSWTVDVVGVSRKVEGLILGLETVETPAGSFEAVHVRTTSNGRRNDRWFARGIGLVQEETVLTNFSLGVYRLAELPGPVRPDRGSSSMPLPEALRGPCHR